MEKFIGTGNSCDQRIGCENDWNSAPQSNPGNETRLTPINGPVISVPRHIADPQVHLIRVLIGIDVPPRVHALQIRQAAITFASSKGTDISCAARIAACPIAYPTSLVEAPSNVPRTSRETRSDSLLNDRNGRLRRNSFPLSREYIFQASRRR